MDRTTTYYLLTAAGALVAGILIARAMQERGRLRAPPGAPIPSIPNRSGQRYSTVMPVTNATRPFGTADSWQSRWESFVAS